MIPVPPRKVEGPVLAAVPEQVSESRLDGVRPLVGLEVAWMVVPG